MATIRDNTFWSTGCLLRHHVHIRIAGNSTGFRAKFRLHELDWGFDPVAVSVLASLVRKQVWAGASYLRHQGIACWSCADRSALWYCSIYPYLYWITDGFRCLPLPTCRKRCYRSPFYEPCVPPSQALLHNLYTVAVVGNYVSVTPLRRGFGWRKLT